MARPGRTKVWMNKVIAMAMAVTQTFDDAAVGGGAVDSAVGSDRHGTLFHCKTRKVAIGSTLRVTGVAVVAAEVAAIATNDRRLGCVVKFEVAIVAAGATATIRHMVAKDPATIAVVAALVAIGSVAARAPVVPAASIALRASRDNPGG